MTYDELCKSIGIDREAITRACADPVSIAVGKEQTYFTNIIGPRVKPPIGDLSRFVSKQKITKSSTSNPTTKPK